MKDSVAETCTLIVYVSPPYSPNPRPDSLPVAEAHIRLSDSAKSLRKALKTPRNFLHSWFWRFWPRKRFPRAELRNKVRAHVYIHEWDSDFMFDEELDAFAVRVQGWKK